MQADKDQPWKLAADQIKCRKDLVCVAASDDDDDDDDEEGSCLCCSKDQMQKDHVVTQHQMEKDLGRIILCRSSRCRREILVALQHQMKKWSWKDLCCVSASSDEVQDQLGQLFLITGVVILLHGKTACHQTAPPHPKDGHLVGVEAWTRSSLFHAEMINPCSHLISSSPRWSPPYRLMLFELLICINDPWVQFHTILGVRVLMMFAAPLSTKLSLSSSLALEFPASLVPPPTGIVALREWWEKFLFFSVICQQLSNVKLFVNRLVYQQWRSIWRSIWRLAPVLTRWRRKWITSARSNQAIQKSLWDALSLQLRRSTRRWTIASRE